MKKDIEELKLMTMRPPIFAQEMIVDLETDLMFGKHSRDEKKRIRRKIDTLKNEIFIWSL